MTNLTYEKFIQMFWNSVVFFLGGGEPNLYELLHESPQSCMSGPGQLFCSNLCGFTVWSLVYRRINTWAELPPTFEQGTLPTLCLSGLDPYSCSKCLPGCLAIYWVVAWMFPTGNGVLPPCSHLMRLPYQPPNLISDIFTPPFLPVTRGSHPHHNAVSEWQSAKQTHGRAITGGQ